MSKGTISYDGVHSFDTASGGLFAYVDEHAAVMGSVAAFEGIALDDLVKAMSDARVEPGRNPESDGHWVLSDQDEPWNEIEPTTDGSYAFRLGEGGELALTISIHRWLEPDGEELKRIDAILEPVRHRLGVYAHVTPDDPVFGSETGAVDFVVPVSGRSGADLRRLALEAEALIAAVLDDEFAPGSAADIVRAGLSEALVGQREQVWLEAKQAPYQLEHNAEKFELAKDVAAFANAAEGGLVLVGATTRRRPMGDVIEAINEVPLDLVDVVRYRDILRDRIFPSIDGLNVGVIEHSPGRGLAYIHVPPQSPTKAPFLVRGAEIDGKMTTAYVSLPTRDGEGTRYADIGELHSLLNAGHAMLTLRLDASNG